jgi:hypothetical protein
MLLQQDNARPHTGVRTREAVTQFGWAVLQQPPRSAGLGPSDFDLLGPLNNAVHGGKFESDDYLVSAVRTLLASRGQGVVPVGHTLPHSTLAQNCMDNSQKVRISKLRFSHHYVLFSRFLIKYFARKMWGIAFWAHLVAITSVRLRGTTGLPLDGLL